MCLIAGKKPPELLATMRSSFTHSRSDARRGSRISRRSPKATRVLRTAARRCRDLVLAPGGNIPAAIAVKNLRRRPYNTNAFKERLAKSG